ncbi:Putative AC9 transposase [Fusarium oxysporum f. sp. cubense race 1]|uniref:Putative AC9 transposase n=1 Tax=Fusarium oxysporum f. sp. cubense (strain race 1) TaxID=1229664 RepID=N4U422_FUSC1|nr:Putative AC9 transposase [Fusarium oxysporum f. sp. cubense race 1]
MRHIAENHVFYRDQIKDKLAIASSPIHISTDLWTSPHRHALLAVCAQWVDQDYQLQKALLGLPECHGSHSGERQADLIMSILKTFGIMSKLGYHTGDNATSNNTCLESIAHRLKENLDIDYDPKKRRIRCIGHIINLSLQAFLLGSSNEALVAALEAASEVTSEDLQLWDDEVGLRLGIDNETRWSSWYHVLDKLFKKKAQIVQFMHENEQILGENRLTAADWDLLQKAYLFLQPFDGATLCAEGNKASLSQSLFLMDCLLSHYENEKVSRLLRGSEDVSALIPRLRYLSHAFCGRDQCGHLIAGLNS